MAAPMMAATTPGERAAEGHCTAAAHAEGHGTAAAHAVSGRMAEGSRIGVLAETIWSRYHS